MKRAFPAIILLICSLSLWSGCVINIPLTPAMGPLEEQVLEGKGDKKIVLLDITGVISEKAKRKGFGPEEPPLPDRFREELRKAADDDDVVGVMVRINSPGGTVSASDILYHELKAFRKRTGKKVYATFTGLGTSGAYYLASAADRIYAHPTAVTGSIGVIAVQVDATGLMKKLGLKDKTVKSGDKKDIFSPLREITDEDEKIMQEIIDSLHVRFLDVVEAGREGRLSREQVERLADGRPYTAAQAHEAGLVDELGYISDAIDGMKKELGLKKARVIGYIRPGEYKSTIYASPPGGVNINLLNLDLGPLAGQPGVKFMYLWSPAL